MKKKLGKNPVKTSEMRRPTTTIPTRWSLIDHRAPPRPSLPLDGPIDHGRGWPTSTHLLKREQAARTLAFHPSLFPPPPHTPFLFCFYVCVCVCVYVLRRVPYYLCGLRREPLTKESFPLCALGDSELERRLLFFFLLQKKSRTRGEASRSIQSIASDFTARLC